jgi:hypothetical protein
MTVMIGIDPHKATHIAVAIDSDEKVLDEFTLRASNTQANRLRTWASQFDDTTWVVESARGLGYLLSQQLVATGETVFDAPALTDPQRSSGIGTTAADGRAVPGVPPTGCRVPARLSPRCDCSGCSQTSRLATSVRGSRQVLTYR